MRLTFLGATHEVTGSCYYLEACGKKILVDCGMEQGRDIFENQELPVRADEIDMVLLTHAHIDHSGKLPLLSKEGFDGQIFSTEGTELLCRIMLMDSAHIQEFEVEWKNRKAERAGRPAVEPLYTTQDAENALRCFVGIPYEEKRYIAEGISVRFVDAGHLLGSSSIEVEITEGNLTKILVFSGDIGNSDQPIIQDPTYLEKADFVVMESTYGNRRHEPHTDYASELAAVLQKTFDRGGNVVIPSFAVGRTQEMLYFIRQIKQAGLVKGHDGFEVYVDSPLAVEATNVFMERMYSDFDEEAKELLNQGINPISFDGLRVSVSSDESRAINENLEPKVILSASGMCDAGRIKHHLKHNLWRKESTILFVGYQSDGTLGRRLVDGEKTVKVFSEDIEVNAEILVLPGISGHADVDGLMRWIGSIQNPQKVFITHGEDSVCEEFAAKVKEELGYDAYAPYSGTIFNLETGELEYEAPPRPIVKETTVTVSVEKKEALAVKAPEQAGALHAGSLKEKPATGVYSSLVKAAERLIDLVNSYQGEKEQDIKKFARAIEKLCDKWEEDRE